jgi:hypothetical protein
MDEVQVTADAGDELVGCYGRVYKLPGDEDQHGESIPDGWVEVIFSPFHRELFRESALAAHDAN